MLRTSALFLALILLIENVISTRAAGTTGPRGSAQAIILHSKLLVKGPICGDAIGQILEGLSSDSAQTRQECKRKLLNMGPAAVNALVDLLWYLMRERSPRFPSGRQEEGQQALGDCFRSIPPRWTTSGVPWDDKFELLCSHLSELDINERLGRDIIDILVSLKAVDAVAPLIALLWGKGSRGGLHDGEHYLEMDALSRIGRPAVPLLVLEMENAPGKADHVRTDLGIKSLLEFKDPATTDQGSQDVLREHVPEMDGDRWTAGKVQIRIAKILGCIGDAAALDALEILASSARDQAVITAARRSIAMIKTRASRTAPPCYSPMN